MAQQEIKLDSEFVEYVKRDNCLFEPIYCPNGHLLQKYTEVVKIETLDS